MPMVMDLGLTESCMLALERRLPERRGHGLPRFGALGEVKPLRPAYLVILLWCRLQRSCRRTAWVVISPRLARLWWTMRRVLVCFSSHGSSPGLYKGGQVSRACRVGYKLGRILSLVALFECVSLSCTPRCRRKPCDTRFRRVSGPPDGSADVLGPCWAEPGMIMLSTRRGVPTSVAPE